MKRIILTIFLLVGSVAVFAATGVAQDKAEVISFTGKAEYQTADGWIPVTVGTLLEQGTVISTGFKSSGDSRFTVAALSRIAIDKLVEDDSSYDTEMKLSTGKLQMDVKAKPGKTTSFTVKSPTATASVRGTSGIMSSTGTLQSLTGMWTMRSVAPNSKPIFVQGTRSADIPDVLVVHTPQQIALNDSTITNTSTTSLAATEAVTPAVAPSAPVNDMTAIIPPTPTVSAPSTGIIVIQFEVPQINEQ